MTTVSYPAGQIGLIPTIVQLLQQAGKALSLDQLGSAEQLLGQVLELAPDNAEAHRLMGITALMTGRREMAIGHLRSAHGQAPDDAAINMTLGSVLVEMGDTDAGLAYLGRACELVPENAMAWCNLGVAFEALFRMEPARDAFEHALAIDPWLIKARNKLAGALITLGDASAAVKMLRGTLSRQPDCVDAWVALGNVKAARLGCDDVGQLQDLLRRRGWPDESRIQLAFTLAKAFEDQSDYAAAFDTLSAANALKRRHVSWSRSDEHARLDALERAFAHTLAESADVTLGKGVIFVVCVPRSGSTLTEQILASHSQVQGGGETQLLIDILKDESNRLGRPFQDWATTASGEDWQRLGEDYLKRARELRGQYPVFTDKSVDNWAYVGAALAMLPGAHVVNACRDPLETCFACYRQLFLSGCAFTYDMDDMVDYYAGYERMSALWRRKFPRRYFDNRYESLQQDTEGQIRRLLDFCGLPFDPACLTFHQTRRTVLTLSATQVREPLRQDTARGPLYGAKLDPLRARLTTAGVLRLGVS